MISRRRIGILAGALLLVGAAVAAYFFFRHRPASVDDQGVAYKAPLVISVHAFYLGANAATVADTVAAPIEEQVNGVEHMLSMSSQSASDGGYTLEVTFEPGTDLDVAQILVQNRVALATPNLPALVQQQGISVRKRSPQPLVLVSLTSPDNRFDVLYLGNYATIQVTDDLTRMQGVGDIVLYGQRDQGLRVSLDTDRLAALNMTALEVVTALSQQNLRVAGGPVGQGTVPKDRQFQLAVKTPGRLIEAEQYESLIVKATSDGRTIRLRDVARIELGGGEGKSATLNGQPTVLLAIHPLPNAKPSDVSRAVLDKLAELRARLPDGLLLTAAFDFAPNLDAPNNPATPEHLVIDAELPEGASGERTAQTLEKAAELLRKTAGVQDVLALTEHPFCPVRNRPCLVTRLAPKDQREFDREQIAGTVRATLQKQVPEAMFRLSVPSTARGFPVYGFSIEFAIEDRGSLGSANLRERAEALVQRMSQSGKFTDAGIGPGLHGVPFLNLEIDRTKCQALGVEVNDIFSTMQVYLGSYYVNDFSQFGRTWQVNVQADPRFRDGAADILKLQVKNKENQLVRLGTVMDVRDAIGPTVIERHNMYPIARITANLAEGIPLAEAKSLCETLAEEELDSKLFELTWRVR
jgi:multidrug efflux pump subunit AcrB